MNREEYNLKISDLTKEAMESKIKLLDIVAVLESCKMATQIMMHESVRRQGVL